MQQGLNELKRQRDHLKVGRRKKNIPKTETVQTKFSHLEEHASILVHTSISRSPMANARSTHLQKSAEMYTAKVLLCGVQLIFDLF